MWLIHFFRLSVASLTTLAFFWYYERFVNVDLLKRHLRTQLCPVLKEEQSHRIISQCEYMEQERAEYLKHEFSTLRQRLYVYTGILSFIAMVCAIGLFSSVPSLFTVFIQVIFSSILTSIFFLYMVVQQDTLISFTPLHSPLIEESCLDR